MKLNASGSRTKFLRGKYDLYFRSLYPLGNDCTTMPKVHLLDYAAGNIRSLVNAIEKLGWEVEWVKSPEDVEKAEVSQAK